MTASANSITIRLVRKDPTPVSYEGKKTEFGIQDKGQQVHPSTPGSDGATHFTCSLQVTWGAGGNPAFSGPFAQGSAAGRFLYLSWKRTVGSPPWIERIKIPLSGISSTLVKRALQGGYLTADITSRRPHDTTPIEWKYMAK